MNIIQIFDVVCRAIRYFTRLDCAFSREVGGEQQHTTASFYSPPETISDANDFCVDELINRFDDLIQNYNSRGSSWELTHILAFRLSTVPFRPMK
jgi:hypothetical protein